MMHTTLLLPACFQLAVIFVLAKVLLISATPSSLQHSRGELLTREPVIQQRDSLPSGWIQQACYMDDPLMRTLTSKSFTNSTGMTVELCINFCNDSFNALAGLENGQDCYCGNITTTASLIAPSSDCSTPCVGNPNEICGGSNRLSLWWSGIALERAPIFRDPVEGWSFLGCYNDSEATRILPVKTPVIGGQFNNSVASCAEACGALGFSLAGMEFAIECWCGNSISPDITVVNSTLASTICPLACPGNSVEYCGGHLSLVIYNHTTPTTPNPTPTTTSTTTTTYIPTPSPH